MYECAFSYKNIKVKLCHVLTRGPSCPWRHYCPLNHKKIDDFTCFANKTAFINKIIITINWHEWKLPKCVWSFNLHTLHTQRRSVTSGAGLCECKTAASRGQQKPSVVPSLRRTSSGVLLLAARPMRSSSRAQWVRHSLHGIVPKASSPQFTAVPHEVFLCNLLTELKPFQTNMSNFDLSSWYSLTSASRSDIYTKKCSPSE